MRSPLKWIGGKNLLAKKFIKLMPEHYCCVEPFAGGCNVILQKPKSNIEIINDINDDLVNFLLVLKTRPDELYEECETLPYSQSIYEKWKWQDPPEDEMKRAVRFFYIVRSGFSGGGHKYKTGWSCSKTVDKAQTYYSAVNLIKVMSRRVKNVNIACEDFEKVINRYDGEDTFFYCDPPYIGKEDLYYGGFAPEDHVRLANKLNDIRGKAMISYYPDNLIKELYSSWNIETFDTKSTIQSRKEGESLPGRTEIILMNYEPCKHLSLFEINKGVEL